MTPAYALWTTAAYSLWLIAACACALAALRAETALRSCLMCALFFSALTPCFLSAQAPEAAAFAAVLGGAGIAALGLPALFHMGEEESKREALYALPAMLCAATAGGLTALMIKTGPASGAAAPVVRAPAAAATAAFFSARPMDLLAALCLTAAAFVAARAHLTAPGETEA